MKQIAESHTPLAATVRLWTSAFGNPKLVFRGDVKRCALLMQMRNHLSAGRSQVSASRWSAAYEGLFLLLETKLLPRFAPEVLERAQGILNEMPKLTPVT